MDEKEAEARPVMGTIFLVTSFSIPVSGANQFINGESFGATCTYVP